MADVNWTKYNCDICMAIGLVGAAVVAGVGSWVLHAAGMPAWLVALVFLAIWGVMLKIVDEQCRTRAAQAAYDAARAGMETSAPAPAAAQTTDPDADARAAADTAERAAAERAAADAQAQAEADAKAASEAKAAEAARATAAGEQDHDGDGVVEGSFEGSRPEALDAPRDGAADDLKRIKGIGPKLEQLCNSLGFWHFDQIAAWTDDEVAWVDANLEGFKGRVTRDAWVAQARTLADGGETDFSKRVDDGDVPSSQ